MTTHAEAPAHVSAIRTYVVVYVVLMVLLALTILAAAGDLGVLTIVIALAIASVKAILVVLYFMHVRHSSRLTWVFAGAGLMWLGILMTLTLSDYITRGTAPGGPPPLSPPVTEVE